MARKTTSHIVRLSVVAFGTLGVGLLSLAWFSAPAPDAPWSYVVRRARAEGEARPPGFSHISPWLREAVVATEDERFYRHHGIDTVGLIRAASYDITHLSASQGASTITEQLAKTLYLNGDDHSPLKKIEDAIMAVRLESNYGKRQILTDYLDAVYFGNGAYGAGAAARTYFGIAPAHLTLAQASLLAGLIQSPSTYDPIRNPVAARARQVSVLASMVRNHYINLAEAEHVLTKAIPLRHGALPVHGRVDLARGPPVSVERLVAALALVGAGIAGWLLLPRHLRWLMTLAVVAGLVLAMGSPATI